MLKLFVAGHSDSGRRYLPPGVEPWPERTRRWLEEATGRPVELQARRFAPLGPRAARYLLGEVEAARPDLVILPLTGFVCSVGTVAESVRRRFGTRAGDLYTRAEDTFTRRTSRGRALVLANGLARRTARRALGTRTMATVDETAAIYAAVLDGLARMESVHVVAVRDARFSAEVQAREPRLGARLDRLDRLLKPVVDRHRFAWADLEGALRAAPDRRAFHHADGVHTTGAFHDVYTAVLRHALAPTVRDLGGRRHPF